MSLVRLILGFILVGASCFALADNATADASNQLAAQANSATAATAAPAQTATTAEPAKGHHAKAEHHKAKALVDLNSADAATLAKVHGIGKKRAELIVDYRAKNGNFKSVEDLKNVTDAKGKTLFNSKLLAKLEKHLSVGSEDAAAATSSN